jgi:lactate 2-monooxygenase
MSDSTSGQLSPSMQYQLQIYLAGMQGKRPLLPVSIKDLEKKASLEMSPDAFAYIAGAAGSEITMDQNRKALDTWQIVPRMMKDVSQRSTGINLFGKDFFSPVLLAPIGVLSLAHKDAEVAVARAAVSLRVPQIVSTVSSKTLEEVGVIHGDHPHWFQLYWGRNNDFTISLLNRAEKAGYSALVVTLDTRIFAWRERDIQNAFLPFLYNEGLANYLTDPVFLSLTGGDPSKNKLQTLMQFANCFSNPASSWENLAFIKENTRLPLIVKGVLHPDDARKAIDNGADGIIVSNHGGRQLDGGVGALDMLEPVSRAVGHQTTILFDSGIRRGADVFKAMALGAKAVLLGRPYAYGLALGGEEGVKEILANLIADIDLTLGLAGCRSWKEVSVENLRYSKQE